MKMVLVVMMKWLLRRGVRNWGQGGSCDESEISKVASSTGKSLSWARWSDG